MKQRDAIAELEARLAATQRRLREQSDALKASEARYRSLFEHSPDMVLMVDPAWTILEANLTATRRLTQQGPLVGRALMSLFADSEEEEVDEARMHSLERQLRLLDGRPVQLRAAPVPGQPPTIQVVIRDMTGRQQMEEELARTRRLAAVGHLAAGVAHEINNPLTVMQLRIDLLRELDLRPEVQDQLTVVRDHLGRVARIVQNLQTFARPARRSDGVVDVEQLVHAAVELASVPLGQVVVDVAVEDGLAVQGDRGALEQVFVNLFANAGDAMRRRGRLRVVGRQDGAAVVVEVIDDGPGIPADLTTELFTPFTSGTGRTGLGLAIAWSLVHEHGGNLAGRNLPGGGACFSVTLPGALEGMTARAPVPSAPAARSTQACRVFLLVDDDPSVARALEEVAAELGYRAIVAHTAAEALAVLETQPVCGVLADVQLPGMSGRELLEVLRVRAPSLADHTILMSGMFLPPEAGVRYVQKPFTRQRLADVLRRLASLGSAEDAEGVP